MNFLLDSHALLWWLDDDKRLSKRARSVIANADNTICMSAVSVWEIAIKTALGKLVQDIPCDRDAHATDSP